MQRSRCAKIFQLPFLFTIVLASTACQKTQPLTAKDFKIKIARTEALTPAACELVSVEVLNTAKGSRNNESQLALSILREDGLPVSIFPSDQCTSSDAQAYLPIKTSDRNANFYVRPEKRGDLEAKVFFNGAEVLVENPKLTVKIGTLGRFEFLNWPRTQVVGAKIGFKIQAQDAGGNPLSDFNEVIELTPLDAQFGIPPRSPVKFVNGEALVEDVSVSTKSPLAFLEARFQGVATLSPPLRMLDANKKEVVQTLRKSSDVPDLAQRTRVVITINGASFDALRIFDDTYLALGTITKLEYLDSRVDPKRIKLIIDGKMVPAVFKVVESSPKGDPRPTKIVLKVEQ